MNERIKELARQAGATFGEGYIELSDGQLMLSDGVDVDHTTMDLEKFAELIVKKCGEVAVFGDPKYSAQHNIHKHFGVE